MEANLNDKVVLITGGSKGIGKAIALRLALMKPAHVIVSYCLDQEAARKTVSELLELGVNASEIRVDLGRPELLQKMFDEIEETHGRLDVFVSNAARATFKPSTEVKYREWSRMIDLNASAFLLGSQRAAKLMEINGGGRIIGLSSLGSRFYTPGYMGLGAAKAAIEAMTRYFAVEFASIGINVNTVCGGFIDTPSTRLLPDFDEVVDALAERTPAKRVGTPEDMAGIVAFLCSPESDWIRGQTLVADGGLSLLVG